MRTASAIAIVLASAFVVHADTLYLRDGRTMRGTFISGNSQQIRFLPDRGRTQTFRISAVERMSFGEETPAAATSTPAHRDPYFRGSSGSSSSSGTYSSSESARSRASEANVVPAGTVVTVRMIDAIDSNNTDVGQTYRASLEAPIEVNGRTIAPRGADAVVRVERVKQSGTVAGREEIALVLSEIDANGRRLVPETEHAELSASSRKNESVKVIGGTAVVGAIIGAIAGGGKGAAIGAASGAGAGAAIQAIRGQRIQVPSETRLDFTLAQALRY